MKNLENRDAAGMSSSGPHGGAEPVKPLAYSIAQTCVATSLSRSAVYALISVKRLRTVRIGRRNLVLASSLIDLLAGDASD